MSMEKIALLADAVRKPSEENGSSSFKNQATIPSRIKFSWNQSGSPGVFMMIPKTSLRMDMEYQRCEASAEKVIEIARNWDWTLLGVLMVAMREDGSFWVVDGGHRYRAAMKRDDVLELPCMVFDNMRKNLEALTFVGANTMKSVIKALDLHNAALCAGEPLALTAQAILDKHGYTAVKSASAIAGRQAFEAIRTLRSLIIKDRRYAERSFAACALIAGHKFFSGKLLKGLFYCAYKLRDKADILEGVYLERLIKIGAEGLELSIRRESHIQGAGGEVVAAKAILDCINKGQRRRLLFPTINEKSDD